MKGTTMKPKIAVLAVLLAMLTAFISVSAFAGGTPYGTVITNTATMNYKDVGGNPFSPLTATVSVTVEKVPGLALAVTPQSQTVSDSMYVTYAFHVTNTGNANDTISLTTSTNTQGWTVSYYKDADSNGVLSPSEISAGAITHLYGVGEDTSAYVIMRFLVPKGTPSETVDVDSVTAETSPNWPVNVGTATAGGKFTTTVIRSIFTLGKTTANSTPPPDQNFTYTITYSDTGKGVGLSVSISDTLDNNLTYVVGTTSPAPTSVNGQILTWNIGRVGAGQGSSITVGAKVNHGVTKGTVINNHAYIAFTDSISNQPRDTTSPPVPITVNLYAALAVNILSTGYSDSINVGTPTLIGDGHSYFRLSLKNIGNNVDTASFTKSSVTSSGLLGGWLLYSDKNGNFTYDPATDTLWTSGPYSPPLAANGGDSLVLFAVDTIPHATPDRATDTTTFTFSTKSSGATATGKIAALIKAPVMTLNKWVTKQSGRSRPGDTLIYTIKYVNTGSGDANNIVITDASPTNTTYIDSSVATSSDSSTWTPKTDISDGDNVTVSGGSVTVDVGTVNGEVVNSSYYGYIRFKVRIQ